MVKFIDAHGIKPPIAQVFDMASAEEAMSMLARANRSAGSSSKFQTGRYGIAARDTRGTHYG
jgi:hypothetical protein